jgi:hypothetical protein
LYPSRDSNADSSARGCLFIVQPIEELVLGATEAGNGKDGLPDHTAFGSCAGARFA